MSSSIVQFASQQSNSNSNSSSSNHHHEDGNERLDSDHHNHPTANNISLPSETLLQAAISLKDQIVEMTWRGHGRSAGGVTDPTVYTGLMGTAFTCLRAYEATGDRRDLELCSEIVDVCAELARTVTRHVTFLCGRGGVYALGAAAASCCGDQHKRDLYLNNFLEVSVLDLWTGKKYVVYPFQQLSKGR